ncbi:ZCHC3 protein, partial [Atractosteus spatula]|nr:ZCHC3 protein [Atractosteus spatula]
IAEALLEGMFPRLGVPEELHSDRGTVCFLKRFVDIQGIGVKIMDKKNIWTGKRHFRVRFRANGSAPDGFLHPPASFEIGPNRGYLFYYGQPRCRKEGHNVVDCRERICRRCEGVGHLSSECKEERRCNLCGGAGHVFKDCALRKRSFSEVVSGAAGARPGAANEDGRQREVD